MAGVRSGLLEAGDGVAGLAGQADRPAVSGGPAGVHQVVEDVGGVPGGFLQRGADCFKDQFQAGEFPGGGQDLGGIGPLPPTFLDHPRVTYPVQSQGQKLVGAVVLAQAVTEVREHAVVETGVVQVHGQGVLEVDPTPHRLGCLPIGEIEQELQHTDRGQLCR
jgi:hypothetical protein